MCVELKQQLIYLIRPGREYTGAPTRVSVCARQQNRGERHGIGYTWFSASKHKELEVDDGHYKNFLSGRTDGLGNVVVFA